ncbi:MAG: hypothetical protein EOO81_06825 [Oxalobacteraceae bacterium]|nr:MAG: hypothetical protein EOO81_06825 [Oxalobacteraceae bacterium]
MQISGLNHFTLRCTPAELQLLMDFYAGCLGLQPGDRPSMPAPGCWLYRDEKPIVHLYASLEKSKAGPTSALDHISFSASGLEETRAHLRATEIEFEEAPVPGRPLHQIFLRDPIGLKLELTFDMVAEVGSSDDKAR